MRIDEYIDIKNPEHLKALKIVNSTGYWPPQFYRQLKEANVEFRAGWFGMICVKVATYYFEHEELWPTSDS